MISLRNLEEKDAPLMLEWMHDAEIQKYFQKNMMNMSLDDAISFCRMSRISVVEQHGQSHHFAIVDENDEYLGTISLKEINLENMSAEYSISIRRKVQSKGVAKIATRLLLEKAFHEYHLHRVYLNVLSSNVAAINLYEKSGFRFEGEFRECMVKAGRYVNLKWYSMLESEYDELIFLEEN